jgi:hypothetical protein
MLAITLPNYERMFRVIHGLLLNENGDPSMACAYFGIIGAELLKKHHKKQAVPVAGAAAYRLPVSGRDIVAFGRPTDSGVVVSDLQSFHCWVQVGDTAIDFQAPIFSVQVQKQRPGASFPAKMLQRTLSSASESAEVLSLAGSHWLQENHALTEQLVTQFYAKRANHDLVSIACDWYRPAPKRMNAALSVGNHRGEVRRVPLSPVRVAGAW